MWANEYLNSAHNFQSVSYSNISTNLFHHQFRALHDSASIYFLYILLAIASISYSLRKFTSIAVSFFCSQVNYAKIHNPNTYYQRLNLSFPHNYWVENRVKAADTARQTAYRSSCQRMAYRVVLDTETKRRVRLPQPHEIH